MSCSNDNINCFTNRIIYSNKYGILISMSRKLDGKQLQQIHLSVPSSQPQDKPAEQWELVRRLKLSHLFGHWIYEADIQILLRSDSCKKQGQILIRILARAPGAQEVGNSVLLRAVMQQNLGMPFKRQEREPQSLLLSWFLFLIKNLETLRVCTERCNKFARLRAGLVATPVGPCGHLFLENRKHQMRESLNSF